MSEIADILEEILRKDLYINGEFGCCQDCGEDELPIMHLYDDEWNLDIAEKQFHHKRGCVIKRAIEALKRYKENKEAE